MTDESVFAAARAIRDPAGRAAYLDRACADNPSLRREVEELLAADAAPGVFLADPPMTGLYRSPADADATGTRVGPYKLLQKIGEGGMGAVYMADQEEPVKRRVALKLIKPGMDSKAVLARFEAERQALALMDHPNIARVLDAGTTPDGRPYFAMELVKGVPLTRFCDNNKLSPKDRLELFVSVCQAIQHAHQKGIIHRDIKPSNVLVTLYDGKPVAKVIDFGIAKATAQKLTERTLFTEFGALIGTPEYMAPEQAELNALDVDTRADIYSLGVLLYELLTGTTPLDRKRVREAGYAEMLRLIREVEAERPSARLTARREALAAVSTQRHTDPAKLMRLVRGELDWIVMKALEKDRSRRYETANGLARDIQRFLDGDAVEACPPSAAYRLRKLYRRNKPVVWVAAAFLVLTYAGVSGIYFAYQRAVRAERDATVERNRAEEREAEALDQKAQAEANGKRAAAAEQQARQEAAAAKAVRDFLQEDLLGQASVLKQAELARVSGGDFDVKPNPTVRELLDRAASALAPDRIGAKFPHMPFVQAEALKAVGEAYSAIAQDEKAVGLLSRAVELYRVARGPDDPGTLAARHALGFAMVFIPEKRAEGVAQLEAVQADRARVLGPFHPDTFATRHDLGVAKYFASQKAAEGLDYFTRLRDEALEHLGADHIQTMLAAGYRADALRAAGHQADAVREWEALRAVTGQMRTFRPDHPYVLAAKFSHALALIDTGRHDDALPLLDELATGPFAQRVERFLTLCGYSYLHAGQVDKSIAAFEKAIAAVPASAPPQARIHAMSGLGHAYRRAGRRVEEVSVREKIRDIQTTRLPADHPDVLLALQELANAYDGAGRKQEGVALLEEVIRRLKATRGLSDPRTLEASMSLCYALTGTPRAAEIAAEVVAARRKLVGPNDRELANNLGTLGLNLVLAGRWAEAEPPLREAVAIKTKVEPTAWRTAVAKSWLGGALLGQKKYAEAEPLLLAGHKEMAARRHLMPPWDTPEPDRAARFLVELYTAIGKPEEAARYRPEKPKDAEQAPLPRSVRP